MEKRAFVDGFSLVVFLVVTGAVVGATLVFINPDKALAEYSYIGDLSSKTYYEISCLGKVSITNPILFRTNTIPKDMNYTFQRCE